MKYCSTCGKELCDAAVACPGCGCAVDAAPVNVLSTLLTTFCKRLKINGIIWLVIGIVQLVIGFLVSWPTLAVGVLNIVIAVQNMNASKTYAACPVGIVAAAKSLTFPIITFVYNVLVGSWIGVVGSVNYLVAIRGYVLKNEAAFAQLEAMAPTQQKGC